jgi:hypothetical protein
LTDLVPLETWKQILKKAVEDGLDGNRHAREWLGNYLLGKPENGTLLELVAREVVGFDSVGSRAASLAIIKPMIDTQIRLVLQNSIDESR